MVTQDSNQLEKRLTNAPFHEHDSYVKVKTMGSYRRTGMSTDTCSRAVYNRSIFFNPYPEVKFTFQIPPPPEQQQRYDGTNIVKYTLSNP